jgi:hypothetical protein
MAIHEIVRGHKTLARHRAVLGTLVQPILLLIVLVNLAQPAASADDFWKHKPASQWSRTQALKVVQHSPWAKVEVVVFLRREAQASFSVPTGTKHCDPDAIDQNGNCLQKGRIEAPVDPSQQRDAAPRLSPSTAFLVRWESADAVAQAFARLQELGEHAGIAFQAPPPRIPPDRYVITVKVEQPGRAAFEPFVITPAGKPELRATLKTHQGTVSPLEIEFTGAGASAAVHFFFPRTLDDVPLVGTVHDSAEFTLRGSGFTVHSKFAFVPESPR